MPEHVHLLIWPRQQQYSVSSILQRIKAPTAQRALAQLEKVSSPLLRDLCTVAKSGRITYRIWQAGGGYDRNMNTAEAIHEALNYIHNNPVRRELVDQAAGWRWSSYKEWWGPDRGPIIVDKTMPTLTP